MFGLFPNGTERLVTTFVMSYITSLSPKLVIPMPAGVRVLAATRDFVSSVAHSCCAL